MKHEAVLDTALPDPAMLDALCEAGSEEQSFLRAQWFAAGDDAASALAAAHAPDGALLAALPLRSRSHFGVTISELAGGYWPLRSPLVAPGASAAQLAALFDDPAIGGMLRIGPTLTGDPATERLVQAARLAGWTVLEAGLGTVFELALPDPEGDDDWPTAKTRRKNRWRERRLAAGGELRTRQFSGTDWTAQDRDAMAAIERASWLGTLDDGGDTKFANPASRRFWEDCTVDPALAAMLRGSVLWIGDTPSAFTFGIQAGATFYCIANNFDAQFRKFGPGRVLLYSEFERARGEGVRLVSWGSGDAGYKTEMGATPGPGTRDLLFVRNKLAALALRPLWERRGAGA